MNMRSIHSYVGLMVLAAVSLLVFADWSTFASFPSRQLITGFGLLTLLGLLSEATAFSHRIARESGNSSLVFLPLVACVILFGPAAGMLFIGITVFAVEFAIRRKERIRGLFNTAQYIVATGIGGAAFVAFGGRPLALDPRDQSFEVIEQALPIVVFALVLFFFNHLFVGIAIALAHRQRILKVLPRTFAKSGMALAYDIFILPFAVLVAFAYWGLGGWGLVASMLPLAFIRHAYLAKYQLEVANRDLLRALVKAIEIRDPYTSGHSLRVQKLAERIGQGLGLGERHLADLSAAALVHDIGKIEVVYEEIIKKPGALTDEEMKVIQSHVTRGVEILTSLASVGPRIIRGVRHHHEHFDGGGYPDGLSGRDIPLEGRIINICDAIDAMLSDRPYRKALTVDIVEDELTKCAGSQFDPDLVDLVIRNDLVASHEDLMLRDRALGPRDVMAEGVQELIIQAT
jgi:putative nucleotidyltransferase with HDIG domain